MTCCLAIGQSRLLRHLVRLLLEDLQVAAAGEDSRVPMGTGFLVAALGEDSRFPMGTVFPMTSYWHPCLPRVDLHCRRPSGEHRDHRLLIATKNSQCRF